MALGSVSLNMVWNPAIKGSSFLQASMKGIHSYAGKLHKVNILGATKFPLLKRNLKSLENHLGTIRSQSAKISANPIRLDIKTSRNSLKEARKDMTAIAQDARTARNYTKLSADDMRRGARAGNSASKNHRNVSSGAVMGTAMAVAPMMMPLKAGFDFEKAITSVNAKTDTKYKKDIPLLRETALKLGASTEWSMTDVAKGEEYLTMAGLKPKQIQQSMGGVLSLATVGDLDLGTASDISSNVLTGFDKKAKDMGRVSDVMAKTITTSNVNVTEMGESMKMVGTVATAMRGEKAFIETTAMVGLLGNVGIKGTQAGTHLKGMYMRIAAPTKQSSKVMDDLNFKAFDNQGKAKPMAQMIGELNKKFKKENYSQEDQVQALKDIFGMIALPSAMALMKVGEAGITNYQNKIDNSAGEAKRIQDIKLDTVYGQSKLLGSAFSGLAITMTEQILPPFKSFVSVMTQGVSTVQAWAKENPKLSAGIYSLGAVAATATVGMMALGLVSSLAGKGMRSIGLGAKKSCTQFGCVGEELLKTKGKIARFKSFIKANPLTIGVSLLGATAVIAGLSKIAELQKRDISSKHFAGKNKDELIQNKKYLEERIKSMKSSPTSLSGAGERLLHGSVTSSSISQKEKELERTNNLIKNYDKPKAVNNENYTIKKWSQEELNKARIEANIQAKKFNPNFLAQALPVRSVSEITANHIAQQEKKQVTNNNMQQTHITNNVTINNTGGKIDQAEFDRAFHNKMTTDNHNQADTTFNDVQDVAS